MAENEVRENITQQLKDVRGTKDLEERKFFHEIVREDTEYQKFSREKITKRKNYINKRIAQGEFALPKELGEGPKHEEQVINWANFVYDRFSKTPVVKKERKEEERSLSNTVSYLISHPEDIDTATSIWKSKSMDSQGNLAPDSFYGKVKRATTTAIKSEWKKITENQLGKITKASSHGELSPDFAEQMLEAYFSAPQDTKGKTEAYLKYALSAVDLAQDPKALEKAILTGFFMTDIIPPTSDFAIDCALAKSIFSEVSSENASIAANVNAAITTLSTLSGIAQLDANISFIDLANKMMASSKFKLRAQMEAAKLARKYGRDKVNDSLLSRAEKANSDTENFEKFVKDPSGFSADLVMDWSQNQMDNYVETGFRLTSFDVLTNPRTQKLKSIMVEATRRNFQHIATNYLKGYGVDNIAAVSVVAPSGSVIDIIYPQSLIGQRNKMADQVVQRADNEELKFTSHEGRGQFLFDDEPLIYLKRPVSELEGNPHQLQALETLGFPIPVIPEGQTLIDATERMAHEITTTPRRFMNTRGVNIPFDQDPLIELGYKKLEIAKHPEQPEKMKVTIFFGDNPYTVSLDKYLNFDFDGKDFTATQVAESLRFLTLSYLRPILCDERISGPKGEIKELYEVFDRMPHLRLLPEGSHRTSKAIDLCKEKEGKDLLVLDREQRLDRFVKGNPVSDNQDFTYVSPVHIEREDGLPPLKVNLPGLVKFN